MRSMLPFVVVFVLLGIIEAPAHAAPTVPVPPAAADRACCPIPFVANRGHLPDEVSFFTDAFGGTAFVTTDGVIVYSLPAVGDRRVVINEEFVGGAARAPVGGDRSPARINRFEGSDRARWQRDIPAFESLLLGEIYEGVGVELAARGGNVEKILHLRPGADPAVIKIRIAGATRLATNAKGELVVRTDGGAVTFTSPVAFQERDGVETPVDIAYRIDGGEYGFSLGAYDASAPLVIDPMLASTFLGGGAKDIGLAMTRGNDGSVYVAGYTRSTDFPSTTGVYSPTYEGGACDGFVARLSSDLTTLLACTFLGGSGDEEVNAMRFDSGQNLYVAGNTTSSDFPVTAGAYDETYNGHNASPYNAGGDLFVARLSADLASLGASTFVGGHRHELNRDLAFDSAGRIVLAGSTASDDFPVTAGAYDTSYDPGGDFGEEVVVAVLDAGLSALVAATYVGGRHDDFVEAMTVDGSGNVFFTGWTRSTNYPTVAGSFDTTYNGFVYDAYVSKLSADLTVLEASTFLGGNSWDFCYAIAPSDDGGVFVAGHTASPDYPSTAGAFDETYSGVGGPGTGDDVFVSRLDSDLAVLTASTFMGDEAWEHCTSLWNDGLGNLYVAGSTSSAAFPTTPGAFQREYGGGTTTSGDAFASCLDENLSTLVASTFLGGGSPEYYDTNILVDKSEEVAFVAGSTKSSDFPTTPGTHDESHNSAYDVFVCKLDSLLSRDPLEADSGEISAGVGGAVSFDMDSGADHALRDYLLCGTVSGCLPGTMLPGGLVVIPLNRDWFTDFILDNLASPVFAGFYGQLDADGRAVAQLNAPPLQPTWIGRTMHYAFGLKSPWNFVSNAVTIEIVP